jgi:hypothetical protein
MDELTTLRDLAGRTPVGDEAQVRADARRRLGDAMAAGAQRPRRRRAWRTSIAVGGGLAVVAGVLAASFLQSNKTTGPLPGGGSTATVSTGMHQPDWTTVDRFWKVVRLDAAQIDWVRGYHSLAQLRAGSSLIVRGRVVGVQASPVEQWPGMFVADLDLRATSVLSGRAPRTEPLAVRVMLLGASTRQQALQQIATLRRNIPHEDVVAFLRSGDGGSFLPLNDVGLWSPTSRAPVDAVLAATARGPRESPVTGLAGIENLDQLVDAIG